MQIRTVQTRKDLADFIDLPYRLYREDPNCFPPLRSDQWNQFDSKRNPMLDHCEYTLFLLQDGSRTVGRISAFVDRLAVDWRKGNRSGCLDPTNASPTNRLRAFYWLPPAIGFPPAR